MLAELHKVITRFGSTGQQKLSFTSFYIVLILHFFSGNRDLYVNIVRFSSFFFALIDLIETISRIINILK